MTSIIQHNTEYYQTEASTNVMQLEQDAADSAERAK